MLNAKPVRGMLEESDDHYDVLQEKWQRKGE